MNYDNRKPYKPNNSRDDRRNEEDAIVKKAKPMTELLSNYEEVYLPDGLAYNYASNFSRIESHQMRKVLNQVKEALAVDDFNMQKKKMFMIVVMTAYNAGRMSNLKGLYKFVAEYINEKTITCENDIKEFDQFFTSIVAYHKQLKK